MTLTADILLPRSLVDTERYSIVTTPSLRTILRGKDIVLIELAAGRSWEVA